MRGECQKFRARAGALVFTMNTRGRVGATTDLHQFPRLAELAATEEVLIRWSYRLVTMSGERSARTGGGCSFSQSTVHCWNGV